MLAAPINPADINTIQGVYAVKPPLPSIPGNEGVGEVISVGTKVTGLKKGDRVLPRANAWGTWRTHAVCDAKEMMKVSCSCNITSAHEHHTAVVYRDRINTSCILFIYSFPQTSYNA
jgi:trans-2-enoyl-CoA reductase